MQNTGAVKVRMMPPIFDKDKNRDKKTKIEDVFECMNNEYESYESKEFNKHKLTEYIKDAYNPKTGRCVIRISKNSIKDDYLYYFLNMLYEYRGGRILEENRNVVLRRVMYEMNKISPSYTYIQSEAGKKSFKPFVYAQFNDVEEYDQGYFIKFGNSKPQQCSIIIDSLINSYDILEIDNIYVECEDGTILDCEDVNVFNYHYNSYNYLASSQIFYDEDKIVFSEIHRNAVKIKNNILCGQTNKRTTFNIKTGRAYVFPTIDMYTKKKVSNTRKSFHAINCIADTMERYSSIKTEKVTKEVGNYIQEHCGLEGVIPFDEYYDKYKDKISSPEILSFSNSIEECCDSNETHLRMLAAYNANPYIHYLEYRESLISINQYKEHASRYKANNKINEFHLKIPKKIRNKELMNELFYNTYIRNNFNEEDQDILKNPSNRIFNHCVLYSDYKKFKKVLGENVDLIYKNKEIAKESLLSMSAFFASDLAKELLKLYNAETILKSLKSIYIGEQIKGTNPNDMLEKIFDMAYDYEKLGYLFDVKIVKQETFNIKKLCKNLHDLNSKYNRNIYNIKYHIDESYLVKKSDFKIEIENIKYYGLYHLHTLDNLSIDITQLGSNGKRKNRCFLNELSKLEPAYKKYKKEFNRFIEHCSNKDNIKFDIYCNDKLIQLNEVIYV